MPYLISALWALVYYLIVTPASLLYRAVRRDPLELRSDPSADSYWHMRPAGRFRPMTTQR